MPLILLKLVDVVGRALFILGVTFALPLAEAGRFGITVTLIAFFAFLMGWERYLDLQRRLVGEPDAVFDSGVAHALKLFAFNWTVMLPILVAFLVGMAGISWALALACAMIAVAEQIGNQLYAITLVQPRYRVALVPVAVRSASMALLVGGLLMLAPDHLSLNAVLYAWAGLSVVTTAATALLWLSCRAPGAAKPLPVATGIFAQHRASLHHALIGFLSVLTLQFDRLAIGGLLTDDDAGIYFRHALLVSFAYQLFNIVSYNRIVGAVFAAAKLQPLSVPLRRVRLEAVAVLVLGALGGASAALFVGLGGEPIAARFHLSLDLALILLAGALIRIAADLHALILNATMRESLIFRHQLMAVVMGAVALVALARLHGVTGAAAATLVPASTYLLLNLFAIKRLRQGAEAPRATLVEPAQPATPTSTEPF